MWNPTVSDLLAYGDPVPVIGGAIAIFAAIGLAVFGRIKKRQADFKLAAEQHGFSMIEPRPRFAGNWRTLATKSEGARTLEIREERIPRSENDDFFQELTLRLPTTCRLEFLIRPKSRWRKLEPVGETRFVRIDRPDFDDHWLLETNEPEIMRAALTPALCAHFSGLAQTSDIESCVLKGTVISLRDSRRFLPAERFEHAFQLVLAFAAVAEKCG